MKPQHYKLYYRNHNYMEMPAESFVYRQIPQFLQSMKKSGLMIQDPARICFQSTVVSVETALMIELPATSIWHLLIQCYA